ncbi:MAG: ATP-binding protein [Thomasclavelia sp.]
MQVAIYDDRLEITSPGKLPLGQTIEKMKQGYSKIRNEALANAFSYMNLIEHWGSGIPRIIQGAKEMALKEPEFIGGDVDLRINIYRSSEIDTQNNENGTKPGTYNKNLIQDESNLLLLIDKFPTLIQKEYFERLGV